MKDNIYIPSKLGCQIKWWSKNGSFNYELYLELCRIKSTIS